jgi:hypothetical protein
MRPHNEDAKVLQSAVPGGGQVEAETRTFHVIRPCQHLQSQIKILRTARQRTARSMFTGSGSKRRGSEWNRANVKIAPTGPGWSGGIIRYGRAPAETMTPHGLEVCASRRRILIGGP